MYLFTFKYLSRITLIDHIYIYTYDLSFIIKSLRTILIISRSFTESNALSCETRISTYIKTITAQSTRCEQLRIVWKKPGGIVRF